MGIPTLIKTLTTAEATTLSFVHGASDVVFDSTYDEYMFVCTDINPDTDSTAFAVNFSIDAGSNYNVAKTTTNFRAEHFEDDSSPSLSYKTAEDLAQGTGAQSLTGTSLGNGADECGAGILHVFSPASTTYVKHFYSRFNDLEASNVTQDVFVAGYVNTTSDVDAIQFSISSGNFSGVIQMYGIS
jgi:hypothetical protein